MTRFLCGGFFLLTSAYCILAYTPFSYYGFIHPPLMPWTAEFARLYGFLYCVVVLFVGCNLALDFRKSKVRSSMAGFVLVNLAFGIERIFHAGLAGLSPNIFSYVWAILALFPLVWLAAIDLSSSERNNLLDSEQPKSSLNLAGYLLCGLIVAILFSAAAAVREYRAGKMPSAQELFLMLAASLIAHEVIFGVVGSAMQLIQKARRTARAGFAFLLPRAFACILLVFVLFTLLMPSISFEGTRAGIFCVLVSLAVVLFATAVQSRLCRMISPRPLATLRPRASMWLSLAAAIALFFAAYGIPVLLGPTDWDFDAQKAAVLVVWAAVIWFARWSGLRIGTKSLKVWLVAAVIIGLAGFAPYKLRTSTPDWNDSLDSYAGWDMSFKTASEVLSRTFYRESHAAFYQFLKQNSNLRQPVEPAKLTLVPHLTRTPGDKPNIFIFVIDSLRQDYVSPYNPSVDFTPEIAKFAQDSVVFQNAFTRYGGTALAEPSIWSGVMLPHKQFVEPFYPVNNLQQLLETDGYHSYISVDVILREILRITPSITKLDADTKVMSDYERAQYLGGAAGHTLRPTKANDKSWSNLDFPTTLNELESRIAARSDLTTPVFAYTQPQNIHTIPLEDAWLGGSRRAIVIREMRKVDTAFGKFLQFLQKQGLYDDSIVILTSDHGDAYGEFGRFGHADFVFPQVMRIPLIIHLPPSIRKNVVWDAHKIAFSLDITPSLYYLLGHAPTLNSDLAGRPLFTRTMDEQRAYLRSQYLIASSYAPVYGILSDNGEKLFITDAVNRKDYDYDLLSDPAGAHNLGTPTIQKGNEALIRSDILAIEKAYGVKTSVSSNGAD